MSAPPFSVGTATRTSRITLAFGLIVLAGLVAAPFWGSAQTLRILGEIFVYLALATMWNLLAGYTGLVSVGQQAYVGLGGYLLFALTLYGHVPALWAIPIVGVGAAFVAVPTSLLLFRLRGAYFAIGSWVIAEVFRLLASQIGALGGGSGTSLPASIIIAIARTRPARENALYWTALGLATFVLAATIVLLRSSAGLALRAVRDNELAARSYGIEVRRTRFVVYVATACGTGMVGAVIFLQKLRISPDAAFSVNDWTAFVIFMTVIGGIGSIEGPIIGTLIFFALRQTLADLGSLYLMLLGLVAIGVMLKAPRGLWGLVADRYGLQAVPIDRRVTLRPADQPKAKSS